MLPPKFARQVWLSATRLYGGAGWLAGVAGGDLLGLLFLFGGYPVIFLLFHGLSLALQVHLIRARNRSPEAGWLLLGLALSLHLPLLGLLGMLASTVHPDRGDAPTALDELKQFTQMSGQGGRSPGLTRVEQLRKALETDNQLDSQAEEIFTVRSLVEGGVKERSQIRQLKTFLSNPRSDAYHLAQAEIARLLEHFTIQLAEAGEQVRARPLDMEEQHNLAQWHLRFAECGLLEANLEHHYLEMALSRYLEMISKQPEVARWKLQAIDILLSRGRNAEAIQQCRAALARDPEDADVWLRLFEAHFQGARGGALEPVRQFFQVIRTLRQLSPKNLRLRELIQFWTKPC